MELTGKCKEDFEKWLSGDIGEHIIVVQRGDFTPDDYAETLWSCFDKLPLSCKYGVYVDFFDSVGLKIGILNDATTYNGNWDWKMNINQNIKNTGNRYNSRKDARIESIQKANEIYNQ